eukprot:scaffold8459_cov18-Phaeocystis_antarctica.AAC.1
MSPGCNPTRPGGEPEGAAEGGAQDQGAAREGEQEGGGHLGEGGARPCYLVITLRCHLGEG